jgi:hypothetical protein
MMYELCLSIGERIAHDGPKRRAVVEPKGKEPNMKGTGLGGIHFADCEGLDEKPDRLVNELAGEEPTSEEAGITGKGETEKKGEEEPNPRFLDGIQKMFDNLNVSLGEKLVFFASSGSGGEKGKGKGKGKPFDKSNIVCWNCGEKGHFSKECPKRVKGNGKGQKGSKNYFTEGLPYEVNPGYVGESGQPE